MALRRLPFVGRNGVVRQSDMPDAFFDDEGDLPDSLELQFGRPPVFAALSDAALQGHLRESIAKRVKRAREDMALRRLPFVGRNGVLRQSFSATPKTPAPRRNPSPCIAAKSTPARIAAIRRLVEFIRQYREAWREWVMATALPSSRRGRTRCGFTRASRLRPPCRHRHVGQHGGTGVQRARMRSCHSRRCSPPTDAQRGVFDVFPAQFLTH